MKVLIIGGMGIIGGAITEAATRKGYEVYVLSRRKPFGKWCDLPVTYIQGDWLDDIFANSVVSQFFDVIVDTRVFSTKQIKRSVKIVNNHCNQYIYISTDSVYAHPGNQVSENSKIDIREVKWKYGLGKLKAEQYLKTHEKEYSFFWTIIRPTITFGDTRIPVGFSSKRNTYNLVKRLQNHKPILRFDKPETKHSLCHTSIFGEAVTYLFMNKKAAGQAFHISDNKAYTYDNIFASIENYLGVKGVYIHLPSTAIKPYNKTIYEEMIYDKDPEFILDNSKIKDICPYDFFSMDLDCVIASTLNNLKDNMKNPQDDDYDKITDLVLLKKHRYIKDEKERIEVLKYNNSLSKNEKQSLCLYAIECKINYIIQEGKRWLRPIKKFFKNFMNKREN